MVKSARSAADDADVIVVSVYKVINLSREDIAGLTQDVHIDLNIVILHIVMKVLVEDAGDQAEVNDGRMLKILRRFLRGLTYSQHLRD